MISQYVVPSRALRTTNGRTRIRANASGSRRGATQQRVQSVVAAGAPARTRNSSRRRHGQGLRFRMALEHARRLRNEMQSGSRSARSSIASRGEVFVKLLVIDVERRQTTSIPTLDPHPTMGGPGVRCHCGIHDIAVSPRGDFLATGGRNANDLAVYRMPFFDPHLVGHVRRRGTKEFN